MSDRRGERRKRKGGEGKKRLLGLAWGIMIAIMALRDDQRYKKRRPASQHHTDSFD